MSFQPPDRNCRPNLVDLDRVQAQGYLSTMDTLFFPTFDDECGPFNKSNPRYETFPGGSVGEYRVIKSELDVSVFDEVVDFVMASHQSQELDPNSIPPCSENIVSLAPPEEWSLGYLVDLTTNVTSTPNPHQTFDPREEQDLILIEEKVLAEFLPDSGYGSSSALPNIPSHEVVRPTSEVISNECGETLPLKRKIQFFPKDSVDKRSPKKKKPKDDDDSTSDEVISTPAFSKDDLLDILKQRQEDGTWVECCEPECGKWRYLKDLLDPSKVPPFWTCSMLKMSCSENQVECEKPDELVFVKFTSGSMVWAKSEGNPWWPAMIDDDPDTGSFFWPLDESGHSYPEWYNVTFIHGDGSVTRGWVLDKDLRKFDEENPSLGKKSKFKNSKKLRRAVAVARRIFSLDVNVRREQYSFVSKFQGAWTSGSSSTSDDDKVEVASPETAS